MKKLTLYILLIGGAAVFLIPFVWTVSTALKTRQQVYSTPPEWIPRTYRILDEHGNRVPATVTVQMDQPAAVVELQSGPRSGERIPVPMSALREVDGRTMVQLAAPEPFVVRVIQEMPGGLAHVRIEEQVERDGQVRTVTRDRYVDPDELISVVDPQWENFRRAWASVDQRDEEGRPIGTLPHPFHVYVLNTYTITIISIIGQTLSCSLVAYGFARFRFWGRKGLFLLLLSTMMLPAQVTMIPVFMIWNGVGLIDTFAPLTIPAFFAQNAFFVFLLRQFFLSIPRELDEAAMIDGCGPLRIWWSILMPLSKPAITTVAVLAFIGHWDDFVGPLIYLNSPENYTVSLALRMFQDQQGSEFNLLMAAALIHIVPVLILFFVAQRYFVKGIAMTGMKA